MILNAYPLTSSAVVGEKDTEIVELCMGFKFRDEGDTLKDSLSSTIARS